MVILKGGTSQNGEGNSTMDEEFAEKATTEVTLLISLADTDVHAHFSDQRPWGKSRYE